jgi:hypothetical protein
MHSLDDTFRYSHCFIGSLEANFLTSPFDHSRLAGEHSADCVLAQTPKFGYVDHGIVLLQRWILRRAFRSRTVWAFLLSKHAVAGIRSPKCDRSFLESLERLATRSSGKEFHSVSQMDTIPIPLGQYPGVSQDALKWTAPALCQGPSVP